MTTTICLSREAYMQLIMKEFHGTQFDQEFKDLSGWIEQSRTYYDVKIVGLNYFLCRNLELLMSKNLASDKLIEYLYGLQKEMFFIIEESDSNFIERLILSNRPDIESTLEEDLYNVISDIHE
jgi:hypothetical protein